MDVADEFLDKQAAFQAHLEALYRQSQHEFAERFLNQVQRDLTEVNQPALPTIYKRLLYHSRRWSSKTLLTVARALDPDQAPITQEQEDMVDAKWDGGRFDQADDGWFGVAEQIQQPSGWPPFRKGRWNLWKR